MQPKHPMLQHAPKETRPKAKKERLAAHRKIQLIKLEMGNQALPVALRNLAQQTAKTGNLLAVQGSHQRLARKTRKTRRRKTKLVSRFP